MSHLKEGGPDATSAKATNQIEPHHEVRTRNPTDGLRQRRHAAVRIVGGDPDNPGTRYHRPATGLRATGFREGFQRGARYALNQIWLSLTDEQRQVARAIIAALPEDGA